MKRKILCLLLAVFMVSALAAPAVADLLWEPYENDFYRRHSEETEYEDRSYLANGKHGYVTLKSSPESLVQVANLPNGTTFRVGHIWTDKDGTQWGVGYHNIQTEDGWESYMGWVTLADLAPIYDYIAFEEDHSSEFAPYDGSGDELTEVCLYSYPGGVYSHNLIENKGYVPFAETFQNLYTDANGLRWTFVGYYMGRNNAWVCIDDPLNENLGTDGYRTVGQVRASEELIPPAETGKEELPDVQGATELVPPAEKIPAAKTWVMWALPAALIVVLAAVTAVLVRRKNQK